jgi:hypothetical protein
MPTGFSFECRSSKSPRSRFVELRDRRRGLATVESVIPVGSGVPSRSRTRRSSPAATPLSGRWRSRIFGSARATVAITQKILLVLCGQAIHLSRSLCHCHQVESVLAIHCILPRTNFKLAQMASLRPPSGRANAMPRRLRPGARLAHVFNGTVRCSGGCRCAPLRVRVQVGVPESVTMSL